MMVYAACMIVLYTSMLFRNRVVLYNEPSCRTSLAVKSFFNLWEPYKPLRFYYEMVEY